MTLKIALAGNPNCGKTTMFNALTGANQYVGNWPGVTVEKKEGKLKSAFWEGEEITVTDLPGIYSLSPYTLEEVVSRDYLLGENPDAVINLVDATNIERNLYLTTQILELGIPTVVALNMSDLLKKRGDRIDRKKLSELLGCAVVETSALKGAGLSEAVEQAVRAAKEKCWEPPKSVFSSRTERSVSEMTELLPERVPDCQRRWYAVKLLERDKRVVESLAFPASSMAKAHGITAALEREKEDDAESVITDERYGYIETVVWRTVKKAETGLTVSDKIDRIVTGRILGIPIFIAVMFFVYYISVSTVGTMATDWANDSFVGGIQGAVGGFLENAGAGALMTGLVVDGILGGIGAVFGFLPQMAILFLFLSVLEDCGYMVRIAFVMDRVFRRFGLSGKSFIPLLISSGCGIPGIMASKTIENDNDRRLTVMTATFIPCGAKLPVIALLGGVMAGWATGNYEAAGFIAPAMYFIGIAAVLISAVMLKKTRPFSGETSPFVMELPPYHIPSGRTVLLHVWERLKGFIIKAGTVLFLACVVMWALSTFGFGPDGFGVAEDASDSLMSFFGGLLAPLFAPLGFGRWQPVAASISGFAAKEAIVTTMGVLANVDGDLVEETAAVAAAVKTWFPSAVAAFSFLIFNLLDSPCLAAIATIAQQMQSRKWFWFAIFYQNLFAYAVSLCVYQIGSFALGGAFGVWTCIAFLIFFAMVYMLFRRDPYRGVKSRARRSVTA